MNNVRFRTSPHLVFHTRGYVRSVSLNSHGDSSSPMFVLDEKVISYDDFQHSLSKSKQTGAHFIDNVLDVYVQRVMRSTFLSNKNKLVVKDKSYELFELSFLIDSSFTLSYISANRNPKENKYLLDFKQNMISMVLETNTMPQVFTQLRYGDSYGVFRLIWSDYEEEIKNRTDNVCEEFGLKWAYSKAQMALNGALHNSIDRMESANLRELKKYTKVAWDKCRSKYSREYCFNESEVLRRAFMERYHIYAQKARIDESDATKYVQSRLMQLSGFNSTNANIN